MRKVIIMRGASGSGKSSLSNAICRENRNSIILSTDDYFMKGGQYVYDRSLIAEAHILNQQRFLNAIESGKETIIVDNTNACFWEMKYYVEIAIKYKYSIEFREPLTVWWIERNVHELAKHSTHSVDEFIIQKYLDRFEPEPTIEKVLGSKQPIRSNHPEHAHQDLNSTTQVKCHFFARGQCKYGSSCRFLHVK